MSAKLALLGLTLCACGAPRSMPGSNGVSVEPGPCGRGLLVVESDYQSSNVSALGFDGTVLSESLDSSRTESGGFGVALSGDVALPSEPQLGESVVLIDQYPAGVLRFLDLASASVRSELSVATGFRANPHDYLRLDEHKAYVSRYEVNPNPGQQDFDQGADVLIIDPSLPAITGRIDLSAAMAGVPAGFSAHPGQLQEAHGRVFALLAAYADDYSTGATSRVVEIDSATDQLLSTVLLGSLRGCDGFALSPDGAQLAVSCTGDDLKNTVPKLGASGIALIDISKAPLLGKLLHAADLGSDVLGFGLDYIAADMLLYETLGHLADSGGVFAQDGLWQLEISTARVTQILRSQSQPFTLGGVRCAASCGVCFAADAERGGGSVQLFPITSSNQLAPPKSVRAETRLGLPPRYLGAF